MGYNNPIATNTGECNMTQQEYNQAFLAFKAGKITMAEWRKIVDTMWEQNMIECLDVFQRMKDK